MTRCLIALVFILGALAFIAQLCEGLCVEPALKCGHSFGEHAFFRYMRRMERLTGDPGLDMYAVLKDCKNCWRETE